MNDEASLTEEQKQKILDEWNNRPKDPPSLQDLVHVAFGDVDGDGRGKYGRVVRQFLATRQIVSRSESIYKPKGVIELTLEQKEYVINNSGTMTAAEIAQAIFNNKTLNNLSQEARSVTEFQKTLPKQTFFQDPEDANFSEYKPPNTIDRAVARINKYVHDIEYKMETLTPKQRKEVEALIAYMHDYRYLHQANTYFTDTERHLFESSFIKYTFDKPDLTKEDLDQYIVLCIEVVMSANIQKTMNMLQAKQETVIKGDDKLAIALVDAIGNSRDEYNQSVERQQKLFKSLTAERSKRLQDKIQKNATILNLVEAWKEEEDRKVFLHKAEIRNKLLEGTIDQMTKWEDIKCRVFGLSREEILNG